ACSSWKQPPQNREPSRCRPGRRPLRSLPVQGAFSIAEGFLIRRGNLERMIRRFTVFGLLAAVAACGGIEGNEAGSRTRETQTPNALDAASDRARGEGGREDRDDCPDRVHFSGVSRQVDAQLNIARRAVCRYRHLAAALADGYVNTGLPCIPGQGYHYIKN